VALLGGGGVGRGLGLVERKRKGGRGGGGGGRNCSTQTEDALRLLQHFCSGFHWNPLFSFVHPIFAGRIGFPSLHKFSSTYT